MSSDAEEFDLDQLDHERESSHDYSVEDEEEHPDTKRRSRKRKHAETALGPIDVYESLGESEMEEENARKRKNRRLGVDERRELSGYSQLMRTLETDHVQDVGSHIVNFHRSLVMEPLGTSDKPLRELSKEEGARPKTGGTKVAATLKSAWPLQPSVIQTPKFSLVDEVRAIAQRHVEKQPNRHPLTTIHEALPGSSDPSGSHPFLPDAAVNALAVRTKFLLDQVFGLLHQYRPATAPSTQLRAPPMNWELVLDILSEHEVVDPAVIERTQARLEKILGPRKTKNVRNQSGTTGPAEPSVSAKSADSTSRGYLSYMNGEIASLDDVHEVQKRSQAKRDAQQLLLKPTRKQSNRAENGATPGSNPPSEEPMKGSTGGESPEHACTENAGTPASPVSHAAEPGNLKDDAESLRASSEDRSTGSEDEQYEDERATPKRVQVGHEGSVQQLPLVDDSPSKIVDGRAVQVPPGESEESSDEDAEEKPSIEKAIADEVDELEGDVGSGQEDEEGEDESVTNSAEASPQTSSDPLFGGDARSDSEESDSVDESSEDDRPNRNHGGDDLERDSDSSVGKRDDTPEERPNQDLPLDETHVDSSPSGSDEDENMEEEAPTIGKAPLLAKSTGVAQKGTLEEEVEEDSSDEEDAKAAENPGADDGGRDLNSASPTPPDITSIPRGFARNDIGGDGLAQDSEGDADTVEETEESDSDEESDSEEEPKPTHFPTIANGGENKVEEEGGPVEAKDLFATISQLLSVNRPEAGDAELSEEESASDDDHIEQEHSRKFPSSSNLGLRSNSDEEGIDKESEWEGIAGEESNSDSESEVSD